jgi:catalase
MTPTKTHRNQLAEEVLQVFGDLNGPHPGFRPGHAKGILIAGRFTPSPAAASLTRAPHIHRALTPVTVRFSDATGIPAIPDNAPEASPRGMAVRFHLAEHVHTDIMSHSVDGFPVRTAEEFVEFLKAVRDSGPRVPSPKPIEIFLGAHPAALAFVQAPKPAPASFTSETFYAVNAYRFTNQKGIGRYGRYRIRPEGPSRYLDTEAAARQAPDFLFDEIQAALDKGPRKMRIVVQLAEDGDVTGDSTARWPAGRPEVDFGTVELMSILPNQVAEQQHIIFDPIPRVEGVDASDDPLLEPRAAIYLMSGRRRRAGQ